MGSPQPSDQAGEFSIVAGGPLYQLLLKTRLARPPLDLVHRRMLVIPALAWLPLLVLSLVAGKALGGVELPFLHDVEAHSRFLLAMPILLAAEVLVHQRMRRIIAQFRERGIVRESARARFEAALASAMRLRNSLGAELLLLVLVIVIGPWAWKNWLALHTDTWYAVMDGERIRPTLAGWWFIFVSAPIFQFLLLRWYYRLAIWWRLAWQVSRLPLQLAPLHPDRAGGIGFLGGTIVAFTPVLFAQSVVVAGTVFNRVVTGAARATDYLGEIAALVVILGALLVIPLLYFMRRLTEARNAAMRSFGMFGMTYARDFERKWLRRGAPADDPPLGSADIQSLADLAGSHDVVRGMRLVPFDLRMLVTLVAVVAAPFAPLVLTVIPFADLMQRTVRMLL